MENAEAGFVETIKKSNGGTIMILADKIIELRKKSGMTQDELAEKLGVSRQSVSKWEGAQSTPDLARILKLAEIFSVSTDVLLKDELELEQNISTENIETVSVKAHVETEPPLRPVSMAEAVEYLEKNSKKALYVAVGVALCILSPVVAILFEILFEDSALSELSPIFIFLSVAAAVGLFIYSGSLTKKFEYMEKECIDTEYGVDGMVKEKCERDHSKNTLHLIIGVTLCILSFIPAVVCDILFGGSPLEDLGAIFLFMAVAAGVFFIVRVGITNSGYNVLLEKDRYSREKKINVGNSLVAMGIYWSIITAVYLGYSFITFNWHISWIIWVVAAVLSPAVILIVNVFKK